MTGNALQDPSSWDGSERMFFLAATFDMAKSLRNCPTDANTKAQLIGFDSLSTHQQLAALHQVQEFFLKYRSLSDSEETLLRITLLAAVEFVKTAIQKEIESENGQSPELGHTPERKWRMFLARVFEPYNWRIKFKNDMREWSDNLTAFNERLLGMKLVN